CKDQGRENLPFHRVGNCLARRSSARLRFRCANFHIGFHRYAIGEHGLTRHTEGDTARGRHMRKTFIYGAGILALTFAAAAFAQTAEKPRSTIAQSLTPPALPQARVTDALIEFPLPKGEAKYGSINGHKMHTYVEELAKISDQYRDAGHPKFWGRIIGTESDTATNEWLAGKFREAGLSDVRIQPLDLPP